MLTSYVEFQNSLSKAIFSIRKPIQIFSTGGQLVWCSALKHHQLCANNFPPSDLILNFFPQVEMLLSQRGTKPLQGFLFGSKLKE
jgi:hypothetical protein